MEGRKTWDRTSPTKKSRISLLRRLQKIEHVTRNLRLLANTRLSNKTDLVALVHKSANLIQWNKGRIASNAVHKAGFKGKVYNNM